jgi:hypothetical protein
MGGFSPEMLAQLIRPEGTIVFRYTLEEPIGRPPPEPVAFLETPPGSGVVARLEVDPRLNLSFLHAPPGESPRVARVDLRSLRGTQSLQIYLVWSPDGVCLHVGDAQRRSELLAGSSPGFAG